MLVLLRNIPIEDFPYGASKIKQLEPLSKYDLDDGFFGGNAKYIAVLLQEPFLLVISHNYKTLAVATLESDIKRLPRKYMPKMDKPLLRQGQTE